MSQPLHLYKFVLLEKYIVMLDVRILKCHANQLQNNGSNPENEPNCRWFHQEQWKEVLTLLSPLVIDAFLIDPKAEKSHHSKILSGTTVKLAFCIRDSHHSPRIALLPKVSDGNLAATNSDYEAATLCRFKVVVSVSSLTDNSSQRDISQLLKALTEPVNQTLQNTVEICHYFNKPSQQSLPTPNDVSGNSSVEPSQMPASPKEKAILRKIVCENTEVQRQQEKKYLRNKLKRKKTVAKDEGENIDNDADIVDTYPPNRKTTVLKLCDTNGYNVQHVKDLTVQQMQAFFEENRYYLLGIYKGQTACRRHQDYQLGGGKRRDLDYQVINLSLYSQLQIDQAMDLLKSLFPKKQLEMLDYIFKVLLPEFLIKIYMDIKRLTHDEAEQKMAPTNCDENNASQVSEIESS